MPGYGFREDPPPPPLSESQKAVKRDVHTCLSNIKGNGDFAIFQAVDTHPYPGLHLNEGGNIGLPLTERDAQVIIAASHQAPSEKTPGMFATLVIALPSKHEGGAVKVTHAGQSRVFETSKFSEYEASRVGLSIGTLTYNLVHETLDSKELAAGSDVSLVKLRTIFDSWKASLEDSANRAMPIATLFEHQYTDASLHFDGLEGKDKRVSSLLRQVCEEFGFCMYLANFEKNIEGGCEDHDYVGNRGVHEIDDLIEERTELLKIVDLDGTQVGKNLKFDDESHFAEPFKDLAPDGEDYSGLTGNEGVSTTHFYRRTVAIIMPRRHRIDFFLGNSNKQDELSSMYGSTTETPSIVKWVDQISQELSCNINDEITKEDLKKISNIVIGKMNEWKTKIAENPAYHRHPPRAPYTDEILSRIFTAIIEDLDDIELFTAAFKLWPGVPSSRLMVQLGVAIVRYSGTDFDVLNSFFSKFTKFHDRFLMVYSVKSGIQQAIRKLAAHSIPTCHWIDYEADRALSDSQLEISKDREALVVLAKHPPILPGPANINPDQYIFKRILPAVKANIAHTPMVIAFLTRLLKDDPKANLPEQVTRNIFRDVISDLAENFSLGSLEQKRVKPNKGFVSYYSMYSRPEKIVVEVDSHNSENIAVLLCSCLDLGLLTELGQICRKIAAEAQTVNVDLFESVYIPFLKTLCVMLKDGSATPETQTLFQSVLSTYTHRWVKPEPEPPTNWIRPRVACRCGDCLGLNRFLQSPNEEVGKFPMAEKRRFHMTNVLQSVGGYKLTTLTSGSPYTLEVTKTLFQYEEAHEAWLDRCNTAKEQVLTMGRNFRALLGDKFDAITLLKYWDLPALEPQSQNLGLNASNSGGVPPPTRLRKVPSSAQVIVLD
ncbi:hypothetical protein HYALB_00013248 [Hymenoscyphus albidus]|uniref:Uncharacterized protein n=1 Tax=Hymenoscyphus albidus TaxID=595503 RepID=A0A9N9LSM9_9HELO|nr:hypothetical protein HYALB_00013248 [Hymenoscyphus albidus]